MSGFVERPRLSELACAAKAHGVHLLEDLGGGLVVPRAIEELGRALSAEPTAQACIAAGSDLVFFSLDKLFGGPQGGAAVGSRALVDRLRANPLARAVRVDKLTLAALEPVLAAYARRDYDAIPALRQLRLPLDALRARVSAWRAALAGDAARASVIDVTAATGGGTLGAGIPSIALAVSTPSPDRFARRLREHTVPVIARIDDGRVLLDARTVLEGEDDVVIEALRGAFAAEHSADSPA